MSYDEKNAWAFGVIALLTYGAYVVWVLTQARDVPLVEVDYAWAMIAAIVAAVVLGILASIVIAMANPQEARIRDERDREIARRGDQVGQSFVVMGGIAVVVLAMLEAPYFWIANVMYLAFMLSALLGTATKAAGYQRGLPE